MRVITVAIAALVASTQAVQYIDNNLYAKMTGRVVNQDNAGNLAYDEIYNMAEEKDQTKEYVQAVNTVNSKVQKEREAKAKKQHE
tara:strand:- start:356 stop:610 length:255 start_codon:yes stop_codon:yes gene_type:complete